MRSSESGIAFLIPLLLLLFGGFILTGLLMTFFRGLSVLLALVIALVVTFVVYIAVKGGALKGKGLVAVLLAIIIVVPLTIFVFIGPAAMFEPPGFDVNGYVNNDIIPYKTLEGGVQKLIMSGQFNGQILDATAYSSPFRKGDPGGSIYFEAKACWDFQGIIGQTELSVKKVEYRVFFTKSAAGWGEPEIINMGEKEVITCDKGWSAFGAEVRQALEVGWLKLDVTIWLYGGLGEGDKYYYAAADSAYIYDGASDIVRPVTGYLAKVGETVEVQFKLGYACSKSATNPNEKTQAEGGGWTAAMYSDAQGMAKVAEWLDLGCGGERTPNYVSRYYTVVDRDFDNSHGCNQTLYIQLYNNLFMSAEKAIYTLDITRAFELPKPTLKASSLAIVVGESVTVTANSTTLGAEFLWVARYVGGTIFKQENTTGTAWTITPPHKGDVEVTVNCRLKSDCSMSKPVSVVINVRDPSEPPPLVVGWAWLPLLLLIIVLAVAAVLIAVYAPGKWKVVGEVGLALTGLFFAWMLGVL